MKKTSLTKVVTNRIFNVSMMAAVCFGVIFCLPVASALAGTHTLTATANGPGAISPSGAVTVDEGAGLAFVFDSDENHRLVDLVVDGVSVGAVDAFSFENVGTSHTIEAVFKSGGTMTAGADIGR